LFTDYEGLLLVPVGLRGGFGFTGLIVFVHGYFWTEISELQGVLKRSERRIGKAKTGEEAELAAANEHFEPVFNAA
jgi:hypothetical protein